MRLFVICACQQAEVRKTLHADVMPPVQHLHGEPVALSVPGDQNPI
jgi:hypothetical protein